MCLDRAPHPTFNLTPTDSNRLPNRPQPQEARNIEEFRRNFASDPTVKIPWVRRDLCSSKVIGEFDFYWRGAGAPDGGGGGGGS